MVLVEVELPGGQCGLRGRGLQAAASSVKAAEGLVGFVQEAQSVRVSARLTRPRAPQHIRRNA